MPYTAEISRANPTCFVFLVDQSASMSDAIGGEVPQKKADVVADAINRLLTELLVKCAKEEGVRDYFHVGFPRHPAAGRIRRLQQSNRPFHPSERPEDPRGGHR